MKKTLFGVLILILISQICLGNPNVGEQQDRLGVSIIGSHVQSGKNRDVITATFLSPNVIPMSSTASHDFYCCVTSTVDMTDVSANYIQYGPEWADKITATSQGLTSPHSFSATFGTDWSNLPSGIAEYRAWVEVGGVWPQVKADVMVTSTVPNIFCLWPSSSDRGRTATVGVYTHNIPVTSTMNSFGLFITDTSTMITSTDYSTTFPGDYEVTFTLPQTMATGDWILYMMFTKDTFKYNINKTPFPITNPPANPGDLIISEIMQNPNAVADDKGEWFEIFNGTDSGIDINGWTFRTENYSNSHTISNGGPLVVPSQDFVVLGNNDDSGTNGGYTCDYKYNANYDFDTIDEIILETPGHTVIDIVEWDGGTNWPNPDGASMVFTGGINDNNNDYNFWTTSATRENTYTGTTGDLGSPGTIGNQQTLPVELSSFSAVYSNDFVTIQWETASETDIIGFNIYRSCEDNIETSDKVNMSLIPGHGTTNQPNEYSFIDETADAYFTTYYYWLETVNYGGTSNIYGSIQYDPVDVDGDGQLNTIVRSILNNSFPNPVTVGENITFNFMIGGLEGTMHKASLKLYNIKGELVKEIINEDMMVNDYTETWKVDDIANGVYFYQLKTENYTETKKLLIQ